jgi:hypothetical protein
MASPKPDSGGDLRLAREALTLARYAYLRALTEHDATFGVAVEGIVRDLVGGHLPGQFCAGTGFIRNKLDECSRQLDLVVYDGFSYPLGARADGVVVVLDVSARVVMEVKSTLTTTAMEKMRDVFESVVKTCKCAGRVPKLIGVAFGTEMRTESVLATMNDSFSFEPRCRLFVFRHYSPGSRWVDMITQGTGLVVQWSEADSKYSCSWSGRDVVSLLLQDVVSDCVIAARGDSVGEVGGCGQVSDRHL